MINIKKEIDKYELRFNFDKKLHQFIKSLPNKDQQTKMVPILGENGKSCEDWFRLVTENGLLNTINYLEKNKIPFEFTNIDEDTKSDLRKKYKEHKDELNNLSEYDIALNRAMEEYVILGVKNEFLFIENKLKTTKTYLEYYNNEKYLYYPEFDTSRTEYEKFDCVLNIIRKSDKKIIASILIELESTAENGGHGIQWARVGSVNEKSQKKGLSIGVRKRDNEMHVFIKFLLGINSYWCATQVFIKKFFEFTQYENSAEHLKPDNKDFDILKMEEYYKLSNDDKKHTIMNDSYDNLMEFLIYIALKNGEGISSRNPEYYNKLFE